MDTTTEIEGLEFNWGKEISDVQFFYSFMFHGVEYALYDSVYLRNDDEPEPYIEKLIDIWEDIDESRKVKVLWYFRPGEIRNFLGTEDPPVNELFLACGEGIGLTNVNLLEAITGKCNVVCTLKDDRNPQPSEEEIERAEFVFYRTFAVGKRTISEIFDEKIAGIDVKVIFTGVDDKNSSGINPEFDSEEKEISERLSIIDLDQKDVAKNAASPRHDSQTKEASEHGGVGTCETPGSSKQNKIEEHKPNTVKDSHFGSVYERRRKKK